MDFLKSAVASAINKGPPFPYNFGDRVDIDHSLWTLHNGTKREDGSNCSIFTFDINANRSRLPLAKNTVRKLRTLRHPGVIKVLDTVETETHINIATERVTPLSWHVRRKSLSPEILKWGLFTIAKTIKFINEEASSVHGSLSVASIFTSESGEWRLAGFDCLSSMKDDEAVIFTYGSLVPDSARYCPPEVASSGWDVIKRHPLPAVDAFNFGVLVFEVFNGSFGGREIAGQTKNIPPSMQQSYKRLVNTNPKGRLSVGTFYEQGKRNGGFFETPLIRVTEGVESLGVKTENERAHFLGELDDVADDFPEDFFKLKLLPELLKSVEFGGGGPKVFGVVMKIGGRLSDDEYNSKITPVIVRLFSSPDRAIRVCLLDNLPLMIDHLSQKTVNDRLFPQMITGFTDVAPILREQTVKAVLVIISKLSDRTVNGELLKYLAKTANDEQPGIRTNTTICLGKISKNLGQNTRQKVLAAAFLRSLRDPFVHARNAALMSLAATSEIFSDDDCANRLLPAICPSLIDQEKAVRDQANKTLDVFLSRVRKYSQTLPDSTPPAAGSVESGAGAVPRMSTPQNDAGWAGWAISSFTNKVAAASGEMQTKPNGAASKPKIQDNTRSTSVPPAVDSGRPSLSSSASASQLHRKALESPALSSTKSGEGEYNWDENENDDFDAAWGEMDDDDADAFFDAQAGAQTTTSTSATSPTNSTSLKPPQSSSSASNPYDDGGEPDFAGWLAAQTQQKKSGKALPKGLAKKQTPANGRPTVAGTRGTTTGGLGSGPGAKKAATTSVPKSPLASGTAKKPASKTIDTKPKESNGNDNDDDDGWGDGWD